MKFDELDSKMRVFETAHDHCVLPGIYIVARLDGRNFTRLTKETHQFQAPFDVKFRDCMIETTRHLLDCGFRIIYGYTESDEISLLMHPEENLFGRKMRMLNSVLAGEASARFSLFLGSHGCFDCRISQLHNISLVVDYFRWRNEDAHRNALNAYCYWTLRKDGQNAQNATKAFVGLSVAEKHELLFQHGINFNDLPNWQNRGIGFYRELYEKPAINHKTGESIVAERHRIKTELNLPVNEAYSEFVKELIFNTA